MRTILALVLFGGLFVVASQAAAQDKTLGVIHLSHSAGPASERSSHEYDCGQFGGHKVELVFENHLGVTSGVTRLRMDGRDYTAKVNAIDDLGGSYLQNPYLFCQDVGVVIGLQAIDRKHPIPRRNVEITVNSKTFEVDVRELIDSDGSIEKGDDAFKHDCDALKSGAPDGASSTLWANQEFRQAFNDALLYPDAVSRAAGDGESIATRSGRFLAGVVSRNSALALRSYSAGVERHLSGLGAPSALTIAASCGFGEGVSRLLEGGVDTNAGKDRDAGAFNIALLRGDNMLMQDILHHGYRLDAGRRCKSSKYILARDTHPIVPRIARAIEGTTCKTD